MLNIVLKDMIQFGPGCHWSDLPRCEHHMVQVFFVGQTGPHRCQKTAAQRVHMSSSDNVDLTSRPCEVYERVGRRLQEWFSTPFDPSWPLWKFHLSRRSNSHTFLQDQWKDKDLSIKGKFLKVKISEKWKSVDIKPGVLLIKQQDGTHEPECKHVRQVTA